ncbi:MAG: non-canonical purine NTP diphosphatase [Bacteroidales bacterium]|nr:non-canonical purine NTP diphosphatase [Bacteroidales bacterium]
MKSLVIASNNQHKIEEISPLISDHFKLLSLYDIGFDAELEETASTLEGNALMKAEAIFSKFKSDCFADDTGLEIEALDGRPGVYSARYSGTAHDSEANMKKVLTEMDGKTNRNARFRTVICLIIEGKFHYFEGIVNGILTSSPKGNQGFGYDPIFQPIGFSNTFAEMDLQTKNQISHRAIAVQKLVKFLNSQK